MAELDRINAALAIATSYGGIDGAHHKTWVIDQMIRALTGCPLAYQSTTDVTQEYKNFIAVYRNGEDGPETYDWDEGIAP